MCTKQNRLKEVVLFSTKNIIMFNLIYSVGMITCLLGLIELSTKLRTKSCTRTQHSNCAGGET